MKMIVATIRPAKFSDVKEALARIDMEQMTVYQVSGSENRESPRKQYGGDAVESNLVGKMRLEIAVDDDKVQPVVDAICSAARTLASGDGMISVYTIVRSIKIRTGEEGPGTL